MASTLVNPPLWCRTFVRSEKPDIDRICTPDILQENFTDEFGKFLLNGNSGKFTLDKVFSFFCDPKNPYDLQVFAVADGSFISHPDPQKPENCSWFNPHLRFVGLVSSLDHPERHFFIVGSNEVESQDRFVQVASWDVTISEYRFYGKEYVQPEGVEQKKVLGWVYQGRSSDAFKEETSYVGPFGGHVNGAVVMKELQKPWYHWRGGTHSTISDCLSMKEKATLKNIRYLSTDGILFAGINNPDILESAVKRGVDLWFKQRARLDFAEAFGDPAPAQRGSMKRWMAHLLLTTTINITASTDAYGAEGARIPPSDAFWNNMLLSQRAFSDLMPKNIPSLEFERTLYDVASGLKNFNLQLIQENRSGKYIEGYQNYSLKCGTLGGGKMGNYHQTKFIGVQHGEGIPFVTVQPSYEDTQGCVMMQTMGESRGLLTEAAFNALIMLDFCNPVYSWRRGVLMQYVPDTTIWDPETKTYDFQSKFIENIKKSSYAKDVTSPEAQFLHLWEHPDLNHQDAILEYINKVKTNLLPEMEGETEEKKNVKTQKFQDYLALQECRRRIFRPLPLNEFGFTLPYAVGYKATNLIEMRMDGTVVQMEERGQKFIEAWTGTLWDENPRLIPLTESLASEQQDKGISLMGEKPQGIRTAPLVCEEKRKESGCPFVGVRDPRSSL
ncbi:hypothetical protein BDZ91DRAFT_853126 [Kalaharituber pfeilii]|nr:hypothetical protein BDZ91DRAFT_853126 [Kalaharituber pfeilii]